MTDPARFPVPEGLIVSIELFRKQLEGRRDMFTDNRDSQGRAASHLSFAAIGFGALATVLVGCNKLVAPAWQDLVSGLALVATAMTTAIQSWAGSQSFKRNATFYADGADHFWRYWRMLGHLAARDPSEERDQQINSLYREFELDLLAYHQEWKRLSLSEGELKSK